MESLRELAQMDAEELRSLAATLFAERNIERSAHAALVAELKAKQLKIDQLTHKMAVLKRWRFDRKSEQMDVVQRSLLDESIDADIEAITLELEALARSRRRLKTSPGRGAKQFCHRARDPVSQSNHGLS